MLKRYPKGQIRCKRAVNVLASASLAVILCSSAGFAANSNFATKVESYSPGPSQYSALTDPSERDYYMGLYMNPARAIGAPVGLTATRADNTSVVTLGDGGNIVLSFDHQVVDDPANPGGYDFIVYSNAIFSSTPTTRWQEPATVEISQDGVNWYLIKPNILPSQLRKSTTGSLPQNVDTGTSNTILRNYAEYTPTLAKPTNRTNDEFFTVPDRQSVQNDTGSLNIDATSGGGDAMNIGDAVKKDAQGNYVPAGITWFKYIRLTDAVVGDTAGDFCEVSSEIDAVADVAPAVTIGQAKKLSPTSNYAVIWEAKVTAVFSDGFWIEQPDRSAGMKILSTKPVAEGDLLIVTGHVTTASGDKVIADPAFTICKNVTPLKPMGLSNRAAFSNIAQGVLVRVWGKRRAAVSGSFVVDDGSGNPINVSYDVNNPPAIPNSGEFVVCTGILTKDSTGNLVVKTRKPEDIAH